MTNCKELWQHQLEGAEFLLREKKACLFFEVGTGKTLTAKYALSKLSTSLKVLICAPKMAINNVWLTEKSYDIDDWYDVDYINYEKISRDKEFKNRKYDVVILDEVHRIKGRKSKVSKYLKKVCSEAEYVWGLTGTPVANNYCDIYNIYNNMSIQEFDENYETFVKKYFFYRNIEVSYHIFLPIIIGVRELQLEELLFRINKHCMVKKADFLNLTPEIRKIIVPFTRFEEFKMLEQGILREYESEDTPIKLVRLNKLHQMSNNFVYSEEDTIIKYGENEKLNYLRNYLEDLLEETDKTIIIYWFRKDKIDLLTLPYSITDDPTKFKENQILLLQFGSAESLNLQFCHSIIFYTYNYSYLKFEQSVGRIKRIGQTSSTILITIFINDIYIERNIWDAIEKKKSLDSYLKGALEK